MMIVLKKIICSSLNGTAKPLMILAKISKSSGAPLNFTFSWIKVWKQSVMAFLIIFLLGTNFAYNLCKIFFKYSLSLGSSESNSSKNLIKLRKKERTGPF